MVGTIQFNATLHGVRAPLESAGYRILIPKISPLSDGEILGCTAPRLDVERKGVDHILYLGDGKFHLENADDT